MENTETREEYEKNVNDITTQATYTQPEPDYDSINRQKPQHGKGKSNLKRALFIILAVFVAAGIKVGVKSVTEGIFNPKYEPGVIKGDTYTSEFLGFKFECPDDSEMNAQMLNENAEKILGLDDNEYYQEGKQSTISELSVSDNTGASNFNIVLQKGKLDSLEKYQHEIESEFENAYSAMGVSMEISDVTKDDLAGEEYDVIEMTNTMYGIELKQKQYIREIGKYTVIITFTGDMEKYRDCFSEIK